MYIKRLQSSNKRHWACSLKSACHMAQSYFILQLENFWSLTRPACPLKVFQNKNTSVALWKCLQEGEAQKKKKDMGPYFMLRIRHWTHHRTLKHSKRKSCQLKPTKHSNDVGLFLVYGAISAPKTEMRVWYKHGPNILYASIILA